jgi:glycosyltransferase involved in cell wall biosynthesis
MRVTIVTPCYNSAATLEATIKSVLAQTYPNIEYIIMDGGSKDNTAEIANRYADKLTFVSEKDNGQADAINKGWRRASGDILAWLNADDHYFPETVQNAVDYFSAHPDAMWLYGTAESINEHGDPFHYRNYRDSWDYDTLVNVGCFVNQPSVFLSRKVIDEFGYIDDSLHFGMDYEYWLRIGKKYPAHYVPSVKVRIIRASTTKTESGGVPRLREVEAIARRYGAKDLPSGTHHEWGWVFAEQTIRDIRAGKWKDAAQNFKQIWRYPTTLPRSFAKLFIRFFVPRRVETWLRQRFVRA